MKKNLLVIIILLLTICSFKITNVNAKEIDNLDTELSVKTSLKEMQTPMIIASSMLILIGVGITVVIAKQFIKNNN